MSRTRSGDAAAAAVAAVRLFARCYPFRPAASDELVRSLNALDGDEQVDAETVVRAGYGLCVVLAPAVAAGLFLAGGFPRLAVPPVALAAGLAAAHAVHRAPVLLAAVRRTRAVGAASELVSALVLGMRLRPVPERAVRFAAESTAGPLARSLSGAVTRAATTPESGLDSFAAEWAPWFPALDRAASLVVAAAHAPSDHRKRLLDRATAAVDAELRDSAASFARELRAPVTGLYAFGVLLPLALVGVLPAAAAAGVPVTAGAFVAVYDVVLPAALVVAGAKLLLARPVAFPVPSVAATHPGLPSPRRRAVGSVGVGAGSAAVSAALASAVAAPWAAPVVAVGVGVGTAAVVWFRPVKAVRDEVAAVQRGLPDALALVGRRVADGASVETAVEDVSAALTGPVGDAFADAARRRRALGVDVRAAFVGDGGPFAAATGRRLRAAGTLLSVAAREGRPAGAALVSHAERLDELHEHERAARRDLADVTGTLRDTAAVFGPLVGGASVALAARLSAVDAAGAASTAAVTASAGRGGVDSSVAVGAGALPISTLGPAVGVYVLLMAATLTTLAVGVDRGLDRATVGVRVGEALLCATGAFLVGYVAAALVV
ncbi:type II secretion system protein [Halobaculum sp. P14]|uniref:type II secretion system protein n=1 Tax=Halobaculum sp. P14 TaxID=3421638 RepID=UPI003EB86BB1